MNDIQELVEVIKQIVEGVIEDEEPVQVEYGTVKSLDPFTIDMGEFTIEEDLITLTRTVKVLLDNETCCEGCSGEGCSCSGTTCRFGKLSVGDCVACLKEAGGDGWLVLDAAEVEEDE